jgi:uracil-DNA glycosylase
VVIARGAFDGAHSYGECGRPTTTKFAHGAAWDIGRSRTLLYCYHPSQRNTFASRLTGPMFDAVFTRARELAAA